jgi:hypothetical protein|tara:strand:+ start:722 stop:898 length:177 start_codon:yes stop_codon:yes gene_type:complete
MTISRAQMSKQISKPGKKKKIKKVIKGLKKASKTHASQAKTLQGVIGGRSKKGNGKKA